MRIIEIATACILVGACQSASDASASRSSAPTADSVASSVETSTADADEQFACDEDSLPSEVFAPATSSQPAVHIQPGSSDSTRHSVIALRVDRCGFGRGLVRRLRSSGVIELMPFPEGFRDALTTLDVSSDDKFISFVEFDGEYGAFAVIRTFPQGALVARSRRLTVEGGDTICGAAEFLSDSTWAAYVCAAVPGQDLWVRLRAPIRGGTIVEDTVQFALRHLP